MYSFGCYAMRAIVIHPHLDVKGGSERLTKILCESLLDMGIDIRVITAKISDWFNSIRSKITYLKTEDRSAEVVAKVIAEISQSFNPDFIVNMLQEPFFCYAAKQGSNKPCVMYIHFPIDEEIEEKNLDSYFQHYRYPHLSFQNLGYVDAIAVNSKRTGLATWFIWGIEPEVAYPSIDSIFFSSEIPEKRDTKTILYVGRFVALKRQDFLLSAFERIKREVPEAKLVITGFVDPRHRDYYEHVKEVYESLQDKLKDVELIPNPDDKTLLELYREAKVYTHPRVGEHFGMAPVEAMSQLTPVVIRAPTGLAEVMTHGIEGFVAKSDTELIEYTIKVLKMDRDRWSEMGRAGYRLAQKFRPEAFGKRILEIVTSIRKRGIRV